MAKLKKPKRYGMPYQGSKTRLAERLLDLMPSGGTFVDLFCGGCAMTHCAMLKNKFEKYIINDINPLIPRLFLDAINGKYKNENRWISREDFARLLNTDPFVAVAWSFGNNLRRYLYGKQIEALRRAAHYFIFFNDKTPFKKMKIDIPDCNISVNYYYDRYQFVRKFIAANQDEILKRYMQFITKTQGISEDCDVTLASLGRLESLQRLSRLQDLQSLSDLQRLQEIHGTRLSPNLRASSIDYRKVAIPKDAVVYCDIPYESTTGYGKQERLTINYADFYEWAGAQKNPVYVSSYKLPDCFCEVGSWQCNSTMNAQTVKPAIERLYVPRHQYAAHKEQYEHRKNRLFPAA